MTLVTATIAYDNSTDALFRQWGIDLHSLMTGSGWTYVSQTGDAGDFSGVTKPSAANQQRWFMMYKENDGETELYLKLFGGSGNDGATTPEISTQIGFAINGSGGFTGTQLSQRYGTRFTAASLATRASRSDSAFSLSVNDARVHTVDRSRNGSTGDVDGAGATICVLDSANSVAASTSGFGGRGYMEYVGSSGGVWGAISIGTRFQNVPVFSGTYGRGTNVGLITVQPWDAGNRPSPISLVLGSATDFSSAGTAATVPMYGVNHEYRQTSIFGDNGNVTRVLVIDE